MQLALIADIIGDAATLDRAIERGLTTRMAIREQDLATGFLAMLTTYKEEKYLSTNKQMPFRILLNGHPYFLKFSRELHHVISAYLYRETLEDPVKTSNKAADDPVLFWTTLNDAVAQLRQLGFIH